MSKETISMKEAVARAMQADAGHPADELYWDTPCTGAVVWRSLATAAIKAMRERMQPTAYRYVHNDYAGRKVSRYGSHAERVNGHDPIEVHPLYEIAMIDAALSQE